MICCYTVMFKEEESIEKRDIKIPRAQLLPCRPFKEPKNKPDAKREDLERRGFGGWDCCLTTMLRRYKWIAWSGEDTVDYSGRELTVLFALSFTCAHTGLLSLEHWLFNRKSIHQIRFSKIILTKKCNKYAHFHMRQHCGQAVIAWKLYFYFIYIYIRCEWLTVYMYSKHYLF